MGALPQAVEGVLEAALVSELTVVGPGGEPVTHPMIPLYDGERVYMTSSVLFSRKLDHIRRDPKVAVSVTDPVAVGGASFVPVTVQGEATLHEDDPHTDWERILPLWTAKEPAVEEFYAKRVALPLFWERVLIEIRPIRAWWWPDGPGSPPRVVEVVGAGS